MFDSSKHVDAVVELLIEGEEGLESRMLGCPDDRSVVLRAEKCGAVGGAARRRARGLRVGRATCGRCQDLPGDRRELVVRRDSAGHLTGAVDGSNLPLRIGDRGLMFQRSDCRVFSGETAAATRSSGSS